ncbi:6-phosphogluconolactonase [soil metagenome]
MSEDLIPLEPRPVPPRLPGQVVLRPGADDAIDAAAAEILLAALQSVRALGDFHLALSGGSTPLPLYRRLMYDPAYRQLPWERTHLWMVDERRVPETDERSNFGTIREIIVDHSGMPAANVHSMNALRPDADTRYEEELRRVLARRDKGQDRLDYVLLGIGSDGHTASLFPHSPAVLSEAHAEGDAPPRLVRINSGPRVTPPDRVTLTFAALNAARQVGVLVLGEAKRAIVERLVSASAASAASGDPPIEELPILGVRPRAGTLKWFLDEDACPVANPADHSAPSTRR